MGDLIKNNKKALTQLESDLNEILKTKGKLYKSDIYIVH